MFTHQPSDPVTLTQPSRQPRKCEGRQVEVALHRLESISIHLWNLRCKPHILGLDTPCPPRTPPREARPLTLAVYLLVSPTIHNNLISEGPRGNALAVELAIHVDVGARAGELVVVEHDEQDAVTVELALSADPEVGDHTVVEELKGWCLAVVVLNVVAGAHEVIKNFGCGVLARGMDGEESDDESDEGSHL